MTVKCGILSVADYDDPAYVNHLFMDGQRLVYRKQWEIVTELMAVEDCLGDEALVLVVGAGREPTLFYLSRLAKLVFATDLYLTPGVWVDTADTKIMTATEEAMTAPDANSPAWMHEQQPWRIVGLHRDGRALRLPSDLFDAVICTSSIEHFGAYDVDANPQMAAAEMARVLKPGGVLSITTEYKISGEGVGWPGVRLFDAADLHRLIIEPSGCDFAPMDLTVSKATLATAFPLERRVNGECPPVEAVLTHQGYTFTSVHLALRKPHP